jgi:hypothetical protein
MTPYTRSFVIKGHWLVCDELRLNLRQVDYYKPMRHQTSIGFSLIGAPDGLTIKVSSLVELEDMLEAFDNFFFNELDS